MNVDIRDKAVFDALDHASLIRYISARGWRELKRVDGEVAIFEKKRTSQPASRVWIPLSRQFNDFSEMMLSVFRTVSEAENRSQLQLLDDLQTTAIGDIIRIGSEDPLNHAIHTLPFSQGIELHEQARNMALAGALSAASGKNKREVYSQPSRQEISIYMKNLRLAQSERGSFVVRIISPINEVSLNQPSLPDILPGGPFERQAVTEMVRGLKALREVATDTAQRGTFFMEAFQEVVGEGVSANLCEAIVPNYSRDNFRTLSVSVTWCDVIPYPPSEYNQEVTFPTAIQPYIKQAASEFRRRHPIEITLKGAAIKFDRPYDFEAGEVTIYGVVDKRARHVRVKLSKGDFDLAMQANQELKEVSVTGTIEYRIGSAFLENPSNFHIVERVQNEDDGE